MNILCRLRLHDWETECFDESYEVRECRRCHRCEESAVGSSKWFKAEKWVTLEGNRLRSARAKERRESLGKKQKAMKAEN